MPNEEELQLLSSYYQEELQHLQNQATDNAKQLLAQGEYEHQALLSDEEMAAYTLVANAIFNLDEAITKS